MDYCWWFRNLHHLTYIKPSHRKHCPFGTSYSHVIIIKSLGEIVHPLDISSCRTVGVSPNLLILIRSPDRLSCLYFSYTQQNHTEVFQVPWCPPWCPQSYLHTWYPLKVIQTLTSVNTDSIMFKTKRQELSTHCIFILICPAKTVGFHLHPKIDVNHRCRQSPGVSTKFQVTRYRRPRPLRPLLPMDLFCAIFRINFFSVAASVLVDVYVSPFFFREDFGKPGEFPVPLMFL